MNKQQLMLEMEKLLPAYTEFLSQLVRVESVYGKERSAQLLVKSQMEEIGLDAKILYSRNDEESVNLAAVIKGIDGAGYKSLILNAHCDVAQVDSASRWKKYPFSGEISDGLLHGRGAQDDKAGIAIILMITHILRNTNTALKGDLIIESVIEDETTGNGSKVLVDNGFTADGVIIVDGTWSESIIFAHLGQISLIIEIEGEPVAACVESRGKNPIYIANEFINRSRVMIENLNSNSRNYEGINDPFFLNVGSFHSGVWYGSVPSDACLEIQVGFSDDFTADDIYRKIAEIAESVSDNIKVRRHLVETPAYKTNRDNDLISKLKSIVEINSGKEVRVAAVSGHCDMRHFPTENICLYGPGGGNNAHAANECYILSQMPIVAENLMDFVMDWCNEAV